LSKLKRIIAIDNISSNQHIIVNADGHTNLNGENGVGKTVTLRASLLFFGSRPGDIAKQKGDTFEGFSTFYFPRETSYLVYEYDRAGETLCVVCTGKNGQVQYQFLNTGFDAEFFIVEDDGKKLIAPNNQLRGKVEQKGFELSRKMGPDVYAEIIQSNKPFRKKKGSYELIRQLRPRYSLPTQGGSIHNVDRVLANIFSSKVSISHIQSALTDILINDHLIPSRVLKLDSQSKDINEWFDSRDAWLALDRRRDDVHDLVKSASKHVSLHDQLSALLFHCNYLLNAQIAKIDSLENSINSNREEEKKALDRKHKLKSKNTDIRDEFIKDLNSLKRELSELINIKDGFEKGTDQFKSIETLKFLHSNLTAYDLKQTNAEKTYEQVSKGVKDILAFYDTQYSRIKEIKAKLESETLRLINDALTLQDKKQKDNRELFKQKGEGSRELRDTKSQTLLTKVSKLKEQSGNITARLDDFGFSAHYRESTADIEAEIKVADKEHLEAISEKDRATTRLLSVKDERTQVIDKNTRLRGLRQEHIEKQNVIKKRLDNGSLFDYLHENAPGFESTIGKVIKPEILAMKGLDPSFDATNNTIYGLSINLDGIDSAIELNKSELFAKIAEFDRSIKKIDDEIELNDKDVGRLNEDVRSLEATLSRLAIELRSVKDYLVEQKKSLEEEKEKANIEVKDRHEKLGANLTQCNADLGSMNNQLREITEEYENKVDALSKEEELISQQIKKFHTDTVSSLNESLNIKTNEQDEAIKSLEEKQADDIEKKGLSSERLQEAEKALDVAKKEAKIALFAGERVDRYELFISKEWIKHQPLTLKQETKTQEMDAFDLEARNKELLLEEEHKQAIELTEKNQENMSRAITEKVIASNLICDLTTMNIEPDSSKPELFKALDSHQCKVKFIKVKADYLSNENVGKAYFKSIENTFTYSTGTPSRNFYERMRGESLRSHSESDLWWVCTKELSEYMSNGHFDDAQILRENYCLVAKTIADFSAVINEAHKSLNSLGRKLTSTTASVVDRFEAIGRISIHVSSKLTNLSYFSALKDFSQAHEQWFTLHSHELPDDVLINKLTNIINMIGSNKLEIDVDKSFQFEVRLENKGETKTARTDEEIEALSSTGLSYLIIIAIYIGLINLLRTDDKINLLFCIDEIGKLSKINTGKLIALFNVHNITMFSALPDATADLLQYYPYAYEIIAINSNSRVYKLYGDESRVTPEAKVRELLEQSSVGAKL